MSQLAALRDKLGQYLRQVRRARKIQVKNVYISVFCSRLLDALLAFFNPRFCGPVNNFISDCVQFVCERICINEGMTALR